MLKKYTKVIAIDQQGGKGMCGYSEDVMCTLCSDSHGTPHAVAYEVSVYRIGPFNHGDGRDESKSTVARQIEIGETLGTSSGSPTANQGGMIVVYGLDGYNATMTKDVHPTIGVNCGMSTGRGGVVIERSDNGESA